MKALGLLVLVAATLPAQSVAICHAIAFVGTGSLGVPLRAAYWTQTGRPAAKPWTWRSGDTTVARVSSTGVVTGLKDGETWIEARTGTRAVKACVRVFASRPVNASPSGVPPVSRALASRSPP